MAIASLLLVATLIALTSAQMSIPFLHFPSSDGNGFASYINIQLGSTNQVSAVLVDTGSSTLSVPPIGCTAPSTSCSEVNCLPQCPMQSGMTSQQLGACGFGGYNSADSSSANTNQGSASYCNTQLSSNSNLCGFSVSYGAGCCGMEGYLVSETMTINGMSASGIVLGQPTAIQQGFQEPPTVGIFGFAFAALNTLSGTFSSCGSYGASNGQYSNSGSALSTFLTANNLNDQFSMCFGSLAVPGVLTLGGTDSAYYTGSFEYTPILQQDGVSTYYNVGLSAVSVIVSSSGSSPQTYAMPATSGVYDGAILDSGTTNLLLPQAVMNEVVQTANQVSCTTNAQCSAALSLFLTLTDIANMPVANAFVCDTSASVCSTSWIVQSTTSNPIIGYPVLSQYYVTFDRTNMRAGFAALSGTCASTCAMHVVQQGCIMQSGCEWSASSNTCSSSSNNNAATNAATNAPTNAATKAATKAATVASTVASTVAAFASTAAVEDVNSASSSSSSSSNIIVLAVVPGILGTVVILAFVVYRRFNRNTTINTNAAEMQAALLPASPIMSIPAQSDEIYVADGGNVVSHDDE